jgi:hypothetical protein
VVAGLLAEMTPRELDGIRSPLTHEPGTPTANQHNDTGTPGEPPTSDMAAEMLAETTGHEPGDPRSPLPHKTGPPAADQHSDSETTTSPTANTKTDRVTKTTSPEPGGIHSPLTHKTGTPAADRPSGTGTSGDTSASDVVAGMVAEMAERELDRIRTHLEATRGTHALRFRITRSAQDLYDRLTPLRESWCQTNDPAHSHTSYRPTTATRRAIQARHTTCAFPTCNRRSERCDLDHTIPWKPRTGGPTCQCNLAPLCRRHHRTKQTPGWRLFQPWPGLLVWITPSGDWHITLPQRE